MDPGIESAMVDLPPYGFAAKDFFKLDASGAKSDHGMHFAGGGTPLDPLPLVRGGVTTCRPLFSVSMGNVAVDWTRISVVLD